MLKMCLMIATAVRFRVLSLYMTCFTDNSWIKIPILTCKCFFFWRLFVCPLKTYMTLIVYELLEIQLLFLCQIENRLTFNLISCFSGICISFETKLYCLNWESGNLLYAFLIDVTIIAAMWKTTNKDNVNFV